MRPLVYDAKDKPTNREMKAEMGKVHRLPVVDFHLNPSDSVSYSWRVLDDNAKRDVPQKKDSWKTLSSDVTIETEVI